jgi:hypothetical protein
VANFRSADTRYGLLIEDKELTQILQTCRLARTRETGGILVGSYNAALDCGAVSSVSVAPPDSRSERTRFYRGVLGLQKWLDQIWHRHRFYYLGEWHYHPGGTPIPSGIDEAQMQYIARLPAYHCPEPVLLIIGGDPMVQCSMCAFVFPNGSGPIELLQQTNQAQPQGYATRLR